MVFADLHLARLLERTEAEAGAAFVEARAKAFPESEAAWVDIAGAYAMFDGPLSPITQTFGLGLFEPFLDSDLDRLESFFDEHSAQPSHEVCPLADSSTMAALADRGYRPMEFTNVMYLPFLEWLPGPDGRTVTVRLAGENEHELWAQTATAGWRDLAGPETLMVDLMRVGAASGGAVNFVAEIDGKPVAAAGMGIHGSVALLAGASTIPEARRQGSQTALLEARLRYAKQAGCNLAMMCAAVGSSSQRNAERSGFRIAYTRVKWFRLGQGLLS
ncbi:MAG: GNAT family N-acetyltransferase [Bryobacteraceae bacterium]